MTDGYQLARLADAVLRLQGCIREMGPDVKLTAIVIEDGPGRRQFETAIAAAWTSGMFKDFTPHDRVRVAQLVGVDIRAEIDGQGEHLFLKP